MHFWSSFNKHDSVRFFSEKISLQTKISFMRLFLSEKFHPVIVLEPKVCEFSGIKLPAISITHTTRNFFIRTNLLNFKLQSLFQDNSAYPSNNKCSTTFQVNFDLCFHCGVIFFSPWEFDRSRNGLQNVNYRIKTGLVVVSQLCD